jgi:hypothetical protein
LIHKVVFAQGLPHHAVKLGLLHGKVNLRHSGASGALNNEFTRADFPGKDGGSGGGWT